MDVLIIGAGVAGLTAAFHLKQKGLSVLLLDKNSRWGGCLHTVRQNGTLLEKGPNSFLEKQETIQIHIEELGLKDQVVPANARAKKRFVFQDGRLIPFPASPWGCLTSPLLTLAGKFRLSLGPFLPHSTKEDESVAQSVTRRFGRQALNLVEPMIHGIYAGDANHLSMAAIRPKETKKRRTFPKGNALFSFKNGMQTLADALHEKVKENCLLNCQFIQMDKLPKGWRVRWKINGENHETGTRTLLLGVPAYEAASLLKDISPPLSQTLNAIPYAPLAVIHLLVKRSRLDCPLDGFGFLAGRGEKCFFLGCLWSSSIFPGRCDASQALLTCFAGGASHPNVLSLSENQLTNEAARELKTAFGESLPIAKAFVTRLPKALPQYILGHTAKIKNIRGGLDQLGSIALAGNYLEGISVNDTMRVALRCTEGILRVA